MLKFKQFYSLTIQELNDSELPHQYHSQNYSELVFIYNGSGVHSLNNASTTYEAGDLLIISQEDTHHFEPNSKTRIIAIKFTDSYFKNTQQQSCLYGETGVNPLEILNNNSLKETKLVFNEDIKAILRQTIDNILLYRLNNDVSSSSIVYYQIFSIFAIIKEAMTKMFLGINENLPVKEKITSYIHQYIYEPKKLRVDFIASYFNISNTYFSSYFKRKFDMSLREYINQYRLRLIEQRLDSRKYSIKEIATEFGFNDESHLSHFYKNKKGVSPMNYLQLKNKTEVSH